MDYDSFLVQTAIVLEQAILFRFPDIKNLIVKPSKTGCSIIFDDDGVHTREAIELYCKQLKESVGIK